jgi:hypothetical protein
MGKRSELISTKKLVKYILINDVRARNSDSYLYLKVLDVIAANKKIDITSIPVTDFLLKMSFWGFPPFESVRRTRQQLQHDFPDLSSSEGVQAVKHENEIVFRKFARGEFG